MQSRSPRKYGPVEDEEAFEFEKDPVQRIEDFLNWKRSGIITSLELLMHLFETASEGVAKDVVRLSPTEVTKGLEKELERLPVAEIDRLFIRGLCNNRNFLVSEYRNDTDLRMKRIILGMLDIHDVFSGKA